MQNAKTIANKRRKHALKGRMNAEHIIFSVFGSACQSSFSSVIGDGISFQTSFLAAASVFEEKKAEGAKGLSLYCVCMPCVFRLLGRARNPFASAC